MPTESAPADGGLGSRKQMRRRAVRRLFGLLRPHRLRFALASLFLLAGSGVALAYPQAARYAIDVGIRTGSAAQIDRIGFSLLGLFLFQAGMTWLRHYLMSWLGERVVADLRRMIFDHLLSLPVSWFHSQRTGELVGRLSGDVAIIEGVVGTELSMALRNLVVLLGGIILLFVQDVKLTLVMLAVVPPMTVTIVLFGRRIRGSSRGVQDRLAEASGRVQEALGAMSTVQAFRRERFESRVYAEGVESAFASAIRLARWRASFMATAAMSGYLAIAGIVWLGSRRVLDGGLTAGELTAFLLYTTMVAIALGSLTSLWSGLQRAVGATDRLFRILDTPSTIVSPPEPRTLPPGGGEVRLSNVSFHYPSRPEAPALIAVDLTVARGEHVALVGPSGAGKSTLTSLVPRFHDPTEGTVSIDGIDVRALSLDTLRGAIALVSQEPVLFSGTIADNIAYGLDGAGQGAIEAAARDAHAHDFIVALPDGYATLVGERGVQLSGGQRQRVALARAILADARILILDEATSSLDAQSEALVQSALERLMRGRTTLVIAHRLSTVRNADRICVLQGGRIVEEGSHEALMRAGGLYRELVEHQLVAERPDSASSLLDGLMPPSHPSGAACPSEIGR